MDRTSDTLDVMEHSDCWNICPKNILRNILDYVFIYFFIYSIDYWYRNITQHVLPSL